MKMRDITRDGQSGESVTCSSIGAVCGDRTDELNAVRGGRVYDGPSADAINRNSVDEIGVLGVLSRAHVTREKAQGVDANGRKSQPSHVGANGQLTVSWQQVYDALWQAKIFGREKNNG